MKKIIKIFKFIIGMMITIGVGALVKNALVIITPQTVKPAIKVCMRVGGYFLGGLAAKAASDAFVEKTDETIEKVEKIVHIIEKNKNELKAET